MANEWIIFAMLGLLGGLTRSIYGLYKNVSKENPVRLTYFLISIVVSSAIGALLGVSFNMDHRVSLLAGYVGPDLLENLAKAANKGFIEMRT